ncbi:MAG: GntR family transcriptional regulator [Rubrivivax sp.]|nr:GntR family transcriptional regulator [Rubrivivax sp.]
MPTVRSEPPAATLGRHVHAELRERLISGALVPGEKLSLRTVAAQVGVSVQPVREAVARLVADQALEVLPNRAVRVPVLDVPGFGELTTIRLALEGFAAERAATRRSEAELAAMRAHEEAFAREQRSARPDLAAAIRANRALHFAVYGAAGLPTLITLIEGLWLRIGPLINLDLRDGSGPVRMAKSVRCHARMVGGIAARDGARARAGLEADIEGAARHIEARLRSELVTEPYRR